MAQKRKTRRRRSAKEPALAAGAGDDTDAGAMLEAARRARLSILNGKAASGTVTRDEFRELQTLLASSPDSSTSSSGPETFVATLRELSEACNVHLATVKAWLQAGAPAKTARGYDVAAVLEWRATNQRRPGRPPLATIGGDGQLELSQTDGKRRLELAKAQIAELELARMRAELVRVEDVERDEVARVLVIKKRLYELTRALPRKLAMQQPREIEIVLREAVDELCREFSETRKAAT